MLVDKENEESTAKHRERGGNGMALMVGWGGVGGVEDAVTSVYGAVARARRALDSRSQQEERVHTRTCSGGGHETLMAAAIFTRRRRRGVIQRLTRS